jgi:hypothetical protein
VEPRFALLIPVLEDPMARLRAFAPTIMMLALVTGCMKDGPTSAVARVPRGAVRVAMEPLRDSVGRFVNLYSSWVNRERLVVRDAEAWASLWAPRVHSSGPAPAVDFGTRDVILVASGLRPTGGFGILVEDVAETPTERWVVVNEVSPGNCIVTQAFTAPVMAVLVPKSEKPATFIERRTIHDCE